MAQRPRLSAYLDVSVDRSGHRSGRVEGDGYVRLYGDAATGE